MNYKFKQKKNEKAKIDEDRWIKLLL